MFEKLLKRAATILSRIFKLTTELRGRASDENHFVFRRRKRPFGIAWRHVFASEIGGLVARIATHSVNTVTILAALHVLKVGMAVVTLERRVSGRVAILAARRREDFIDLEKSLARSRGVGLRGQSRIARCCLDSYEGEGSQYEHCSDCCIADTGIGVSSSHAFTSPSATRSAVRIGKLRMRLPVAAKMALVRAGATGGTLGSPTPVGFASLGTICTSIVGDSNMRSI